MPRNSEQKIRLLVLYDILRKETDEEHIRVMEEGKIVIMLKGGITIEERVE